MLLGALLLSLSSALVAAQSGVLSFQRVPNPVTDGQANVLIWQTNDTVTPCTITLLQGPSTDLTVVKNLTTDATGGQYIWTPAVSLADGTDYVLRIKQGTQNNTYGPFVIQGANPASVSAASAASATTKKPSSKTGTISLGTGTTMHRNTTMSRPTLTRYTSAKLTTTASATVTQVVASATSSSSAAALARDISTSGSSLALVLGAMAAIFYLH